MQICTETNSMGKRGEQGNKEKLQYIIKGGHRLEGEVTISGSKNAALGIISGAMALNGPCVIENIPNISDINVMLDICKSLGAEVTILTEDSVRIDASKIETFEALDDKVRSIRGSYYLLGALLANLGKVKLYMPGGCWFGNRPIDLHLKGFEALGAKVAIKHGIITIEAKRLKGTNIFLDVVSVGATINIMLAAIRAEGKTIIENVAREPHIVDVANFLNAMGADIKGAGTDVIRIMGKSVLAANKSYSIIPDQIEAGTYMTMAAATRGDVLVKNIIPKHLDPLSAKIEEMGAKVEGFGDSIRVSTRKRQTLKAVNFKTMPYPGFPTDLQPQAVTLLCACKGTGKMNENVWDNRFQYIDELKIMGADITIAGRMAIVNGGGTLMGAEVVATDLRAGAALVQAGLAAEGTTVIKDVYRIERGYENFVEKLRALGADIQRVEK